MASLLRMINVWPLCFLLGLKASQLQAATREECKTFKYKHYAIQFPFRVKEHQPAHCGYHGFQLSYSKNNQILLELPHDVKMVVKSINYKAQTIDLLFDTPSCFVHQLPNLNLSASPFQRQSFESHFVFFNCSREANGRAYKDYIEYTVPCLSSPGYQVVAFLNHSYASYNLLNCRRTLLDLSGKLLNYDMVYSKTSDHVITLSWPQPNCRQCAAVGRKCKLNTNNSTQGETECHGTTKNKRDMWKARLAVGLSLAFCLVGLVRTLSQAYRSNRAEKKSQLKIEKFLQDYKALKPSRYSYADIKRITDQFKDQLGEGGFGTVFKGRLSNDVLVAVKVLNNFVATGEEFINEVGSMCRIHHINVARLIGFCADGNKRALVYEFMPNESLDKFIFRAIDEEDRFLSWEKLECIANGTAKGIEYLHNGCDQQILHFDIKPHNILLDHNFNPKISDFGLAKLCSKEQSAVSMTAARGTIGYIAPEVLSRNFGKASHKSDVYSYGMLLLEMVGGRKNIDVRQENTNQVYFPEWVYNFLDRGQELEIRIENEVHSKIARKLTIVGLWCIQWYPADRPSMKDVIYMLEEEVENLTVPPNPFDHGGGSKTGPSQPNNKELHVINELE